MAQPAVIAMPAFLPVMLGTVLGRGSQERKGRLGTVGMKIILKTTILALLFCFGHSVKLNLGETDG